MLLVGEDNRQETATLAVIAAHTYAATWGAVFTAVGDASAYPYDSSVLRYTPGVTTEVINALGDLTRPNALIIATVRNNSATTSYTLRLITARQDGIESSKAIVIAPSASPYPQIVVLGEVQGTQPTKVQLGVTASATGAGTLDIERVYTADLTRTAVFAVNVAQGQNSVTASTERILTLDHGALTLPQAQLVASGSTAATVWTATGGLYVYTKQSRLYATWIATGRASGRNTWRQVTPANAIITNDWRLSRLLTTLTPK